MQKNNFFFLQRKLTLCLVVNAEQLLKTKINQPDVYQTKQHVAISSNFRYPKAQKIFQKQA